MRDLAFPIKFTFKITSFANDFTATDANGQTVAYVRQKMFKLKEDIQIYNDESKSEILYTIKANKWLDFSAVYSFSDNTGKGIGNVARKGWASLWKANYEIFDVDQNPKYKVQEENGWVKVLDSLLNEIPILGMFTGYLFNPAYKVTDQNGRNVARLKKEASFFGRRFELTQTEEFKNVDEESIMLGLMMMVLLERRRG